MGGAYRKVEVSKSTRDKLEAEARRRGCTVDKLINEILDVQEATERRRN